MNGRFYMHLGLITIGGLLMGFVMAWLFGAYTGGTMLLHALAIPAC